MNEFSIVNEFNNLIKNYSSLNKKEIKKIETICSHSSVFSFLYSCFIKKRFKKGELAISSCQHASLEYSKIIKSRFIKGEKSILKFKKVSNDYIKYIIKGRWPKYEKLIYLNSYESILYVRNIKTKFGLCEKQLVKQKNLSLEYSVLTGRFFLFEKNLDLKSCNFYLRKILFFNHE